MPADFADRTDFENAERGLIARLQPGVIKGPDGKVVFDIGATGNRGALQTIMGFTDEPDPSFPVVTP